MVLTSHILDGNMRRTLLTILPEVDVDVCASAAGPKKMIRGWHWHLAL